MEYSYRITKYTNINENGVISSLPDEWTSFFDIGKKVEKSEYERVENQYIEYVINLCDYFNIKSLTVNYLENNTDDCAYVEGQSIHISELSNILKSILREEIWCKLISNKCEFHFGYDFYMYFVSKIDPQEYIDNIATELTVQKYKSPYLDI
jgi:hypothetical protein